jgi:hypothetical protein
MYLGFLELDYILLLFFILTPMLVVATAMGFITTFKSILSRTDTCLSGEEGEKLLEKSFNPAFFIVAINTTIILVHALFFNDFTDYEMQVGQAIVITHSIALVGLLAIYFHIRHFIQNKKNECQSNLSDKIS